MTAPEGPRLGVGEQETPESPEVVARGRRAALVLFGACAVLHLATVITAQVNGGGEQALNVVFVDMFLMMAGPVAALFVSLGLPKPARSTFWLTGLICSGLTVVLWGVTCGVLMT